MILTLRQGVGYHDGTLFKAEDVAWNFDRHLNDQAPQFDCAAALTYGHCPSQVKRHETINGTHVQVSAPRNA